MGGPVGEEWEVWSVRGEGVGGCVGGSANGGSVGEWVAGLSLAVAWSGPSSLLKQRKNL